MTCQLCGNTGRVIRQRRGRKAKQPAIILCNKCKQKINWVRG